MDSPVQRVCGRVLEVLRVERRHVGRLVQWVRYSAVSVVATSTSLTVLGVLVATSTLSPGWANVVATGVGTIPSFELNRRWVWGRTDRRSFGAEIGPFCAMSFAGLALSTLLVSAAGHWATDLGLDAFWRTAAVEVANLAAFGSLWIAQFMVLDRFLFARRAPVVAVEPTRAPASPATAVVVASTATVGVGGDRLSAA